MSEKSTNIYGKWISLKNTQEHTKGLEKIAKLKNTKIEAIQNYFGIALRSNVGNPEAMKSECMALMYRICGYHNNCP